ncbi:hypothetical protein C5C32_06030 [Rathayibacter sp. AY1G9]|nr:hypothetical protein C5C32_06030 [Rathayibacter sp. AY1G9]
MCSDRASARCRRRSAQQPRTDRRRRRRSRGIGRRRAGRPPSASSPAFAHRGSGRAAVPGGEHAEPIRTVAVRVRAGDHQDPPPLTGSFSHGRRFALVHIPSTNHCTLVIAAEPDGARWSASPRKPALRLGPHPAAPRIFG